jgi:sirohydrochlorin ferrochelatase
LHSATLLSFAKELRMKSLLLVAHGSRREASNEEVRQLTAKLRQCAHHKFTAIDCAFLELAQPSIPMGIDHCMEQASDEIIVLPYFLSAGRHVSIDIPEIIAQKQQQYPQTKITTVSHLGAIAGVSQLILSSLET